MEKPWNMLTNFCSKTDVLKNKTCPKTTPGVPGTRAAEVASCTRDLPAAVAKGSCWENIMWGKRLQKFCSRKPEIKLCLSGNAKTKPVAPVFTLYRLGCLIALCAWEIFKQAMVMEDARQSPSAGGRSFFCLACLGMQEKCTCSRKPFYYNENQRILDPSLYTLPISYLLL